MDIKELIEKAFAFGHTIGYGNNENHYKPQFERWWNDEDTQEQVKNCSIPDVVHQREQFKSMVFDMANKLAIAGNGDEAVMMHKIHNRL